MTSPAAGGNVLAFMLAALHAGARLLAVNVATDGAGAVLRLAEREGMTVGGISVPVMRLLARLPGAEFTPANTATQGQGWAVAAAQSLGLNLQPPQVALNGTPVPPAGPRLTLALNGPVRLKNMARNAVWQSVAVSGVPKEAQPAAQAGMRVQRHFLTLEGKPLDVAALHQNQVFILLLEGRAEDREAHHALVQQGLPAGWEVVGRLGPGEVAGMAWLGTLSEAVAQPALDDRVAAAVDLGAENQGFRLAVKLRAVTPGSFELPGSDLADMYRPAIFARTATTRVRVLAAGEAATPPRR